MEDTQRIVKCGNLSLHTPGGFFKKRWHSKYLVLYDGSKSGVKRLELFESEIKFKKQNPVKIIPLVDCVRVVTCQRHKTTFTFEVRTSDQFYLLASKSFQDMNDWVNCLRLVAFGQQQQQQPSSDTTTISSPLQRPPQQTPHSDASTNGVGVGGYPSIGSTLASNKQLNDLSQKAVDVLLSRQQIGSTGELNNSQHQVSAQANNGLVSATSRLSSGLRTASTVVTAANGTGGSQATGGQHSRQELRPQILTASQAAAAAASALAKTRQRQPSLLGACKPQPPNDSPFLKQTESKALESAVAFNASSCEQMDTLTPTVRGQLIAAAGSSTMVSSCTLQQQHHQQPQQQPAKVSSLNGRPLQIGATLDEEEENMLYCSIEDNPSEHNYRVKVIETELALRCQLKCYQLTASTTISRQYEELSQFRLSSASSSLANSTTLPSSSSPTTTTAAAASATAAAAANSLSQNQTTGQQPAHLVTFYQLIIGPQELTLLNDYATASSSRNFNNKLHQNQQGLWSWPYQCIRRYGFDKDNCFMFEAGRKCTSGPGQFIVQTPKAYNIYQDVVKFVNELRTISATSGQQKPIAMTQAQTNDSMQQRQAKQMIVTQIPVTWTPANSNGTTTNINNNNNCPNQSNSNDVISSRRQFFDGLCQLDPANQSAGDGEQLVSGVDRRRPICTKEANDNLANWHDEAAEAMSQRRTRNDAPLSNANSVDGHHRDEQQQQQPKTTMSTIRSDAQQPSAKLASHDGNQMLSNGSDAQPQPPPVTSSIRAIKGDQQRQQLANSISSCASDETDESGYEQGDDSVDSAGSILKKNSQQQQQQQSNATDGVRSARQTLNNWRNPPMRTTATSRSGVSSEQSSTMSSAASSCSSSSSASNSPGQSISRRTADLLAIQHSNGSHTTNGSHQLGGGGGPLTSHGPARPRLPLPNELTQQAASRESPTSNSNGNETALTQRPKLSTLQNLLTANLTTDGNGPKSGEHVANLANTRQADQSSKLLKSPLKPTDGDEDFETSLIRDVYSEISKLHAKFAVTSNGADDSMSSGGESVVVSSSSMENNSEATHPRGTGVEEEDHSQEEDEEDYDSMERNDDGRMQVASGTEPVYSNLKPVNELNGSQRTAPTNNNDHFHQANHSRQPNNTNRLHFHEHIRPPPLYPSILNPIPEIVENHQNLTPSKFLQKARHEPARNVNNNNKALSNNNDCNFAADLDGSLDGLPRARLALNREAIKKSQQSVGQHFPSQRQQLSSAATGNSKRPTNHYLINDVQYAKISRNLGAGGRISNQDHLTSASRRR